VPGVRLGVEERETIRLGLARCDSLWEIGCQGVSLVELVFGCLTGQLARVEDGVRGRSPR